MVGLEEGRQIVCLFCFFCELTSVLGLLFENRAQKQSIDELQQQLAATQDISKVLNKELELANKALNEAKKQILKQHNENISFEENGDSQVVSL